MNDQPFLLAVIVLFTSFAVAWLLIGALRHWMHQRVLDVPNERSSHIVPTPRGAGIGIVLASLLGGVCLYWLDTDVHGVLEPWRIAGYMVAALAIALISWRDDIRPLSSRVRFVVHLAAAGGAILAFGWVTELTLFGYRLPLGWLGLPLTILWIVGLTNIYNFMDGIDGLAGVQALLAGLGWAFLGWQVNNLFVLGISACLFGSALAFLTFNWSPAKIFMGDVGSAFLGYIFATMPLLMHHITPKPGGAWLLIGFALLAIFCWDSTLTICQRLLRRENIFQPHRSHLYQRLVRAGQSHSYVTLLYGGLIFALGIGTFVLQLRPDRLLWWLCYFVIGLGLVMYTHYVEAKR